MRWGWMLVDVVALTLFVLVGLRSHGTLDEYGLQRSLPPFLIGWFLAALPLGVYRAQPPKWALPVAWLLGVTLGIMIRGWWMGRGLFGAFSPVFFVIALTAVALFTGLPRLIAYWLRTRQASALAK
ncbi:MAG: DUF3054 domain-containing protein [Fimbriimonadales bacterium]|nr:DUF3054 domain-containing protein [Fimbriimonadales bacterium]MCS7190340.1 DUF3054 domain-containing protein [Fimbriimonadales bacterium]